ncbi:helix-turn-helix transcriptional regulator [Nocardiopsis sp. CNT-189]|uniref:helix-turn-helix transcriptional regulator n=1 Tax=Nocardiopsis oceanisediminis TaxID=2816862 RepID=UPI003B3A7595
MATGMSESTTRRMLRVKDALDRDFAGSWDSARLARVGLASPTHLRRSFRAAFGESPHAYLCRRRVERACRLLRSTGLSVTDIARAVGYESLGTFTRRFVRMVGETPTRHRARGPLPGIPACFAREAARPR